MNKKDRARRFNMCFSDENYRYVYLMSSLLCISMTEFVNNLVSEKRMSDEKYKKSEKFVSEVLGGKNEGKN